VNTATATGTDPLGGSVSDIDFESVTIEIFPAIELDKEADLSTVIVGNSIVYTFNVTNTGDVALTGITVFDDILGSITLGVTTLAPGVSTTGTKTVTTDCDDIGYLYNTAIATGLDPLGGTVTDSDSESVLVYENPGIEIDKKVQNPFTGQWVDQIEGHVDDNLTFHIQISNLGNVPLNNIEIIDDLPLFMLYNFDTSLPASFESNNQIIWNIALINVNQDIDIFFSANIIDAGDDSNIASTTGNSCTEVNDQDEVPITVDLCVDEVWIDDNFNYATPGFWITHFVNKQFALDFLDVDGTAYVYDGTYYEDILIDDFPCDNTGITQMGEYGCFPIDESAVIVGSEHIFVDDVTIKYLEYSPNTDGSVVVHPDVSGTTLQCNKFRKDYVADATGVKSLTDSLVNAELNWWGVPNGPDGGMMDDGRVADGFGVKIIGDLVAVEPWIGIHAEIANPIGIIEVDVGTPIHFDASESWAYSFGECCEPTLLHMQYEWDFDDDQYSHNEITSHIYDSPGTYYVSLMVDAPGIPGLYENTMYDWDYVTIHVVLPDTPLTVTADGKNLGGYETMVDIPIQLFGDAYGGSSGYSWHWDFGDQSSDSYIQNPTHIFDEPGTYTATLIVTSGIESTSDTTEIIVYDIDELFVDIVGGFSTVGAETIFSASIQGGFSPYSYVWDFGDGDNSIQPMPIHRYHSIGEYTISLTVTDSRNTRKTDTAVMIIDGGESGIEPCEILSISGGFGLKAIITSGTNPAHWEISVDGFVFVGGTTDGVLGSGMIETVKLPFTIGFGKVEIEIIANDISVQYSAFLLGPFFLNLQEI